VRLSYELLLIIVKMAIWSLTQERVEKILKHIGDKEMEIDTLLKLSSKDLWTRDLDAFIQEWHLQLEDEKTRKKKIAGISRRASAKLGISVKGGRKKKRADSDDESSDDDFVVSKKKGPKSVMDRVKPKAPSTLMSFFTQSAVVPPKQPTEKKASTTRPAASARKLKSESPANDEDDFMDIDAAEVQPEVVAVKKTATATKTKPALANFTSKRKKIVDLSDDDEDDFLAAVAEEAKTKKAAEPARSRAARVKKSTKYVIDDDSDSESNGDDMLGDVSMMVKGIGGTNGEASSRPLFTATARPGSSHGLPKPKPKSHSRSISDVDGVDDTDYTKLIPQDSPRRPAARNANDTMLLDDEDEESFDLPPLKTAFKAKPVPKAAAKPVAKKAAALKAKPSHGVAMATKKVMPLSPAAKAYARKLASGNSQAKAAPPPKKKAYESDSEEEEEEQQDEEVNKLADQLLSDEDEEMDEEDIAPVARPARRAAVAAVTKTKKYVVSDEDESAEEEEDTAMTGFDDDESD
jgi:DNA topoisomerase II